MIKNKSTRENKEYWSFIEKTSKEVATWPAWMQCVSTVEKQQSNIKRSKKTGNK